MHQLDAASLYRLVLEQAAIESAYHAVADDGVLFKVHCQVVGLMEAFGRAARRPSCSRRELDARLLPPDPEGLSAIIAVLDGGHQMPPRPEMAVDHGVG